MLLNSTYLLTYLLTYLKLVSQLTPHASRGTLVFSLAIASVFFQMKRQLCYSCEVLYLTMFHQTYSVARFLCGSAGVLSSLHVSFGYHYYYHYYYYYYCLLLPSTTTAFCRTLVIAHCGPTPMTCGSCLCHEHITNSVIGVSRPPVLDCETTFHLDYGGRDLPSTPSDNL